MVGEGKVRVARATRSLETALRFYRDGLGLQEIGRFEDHDGFDGVMLGRPGAAYHLEFTTSRHHPATGSPGPEDVLVFYLPDGTEWREAVSRMTRCGFAPVSSINPYWDRRGVTFEDADGHRVVLQNAPWNA